MQPKGNIQRAEPATWWQKPLVGASSAKGKRSVFGRGDTVFYNVPNFEAEIV
jgi:hypothetical protein